MVIQACAFRKPFVKIDGSTCMRSHVSSSVKYAITKTNRASVGRRCVVVKAQDDEQSNEGSSFFSNNERAGIGYVEQDSAGQTNIFAVETKSYVQGSAMDNTTGAQANTNFALLLGGLAAGALAVTALTETLVSPSNVGYIEGEYKTLTQYKTQFAIDTGMVVAEAPSLQ
eukprot:TRINITY_DN20827_c0_g1_i1.p6 TRINITY_DN20827_c0_g1~~TRINITY_DN20827_c0_g1_i1.p6  ORF type:complete len:170 (+),score=18.56 TRINITY_DN20827_c0_g1_i1:51-560(+)